MPPISRSAPATRTRPGHEVRLAGRAPLWAAYAGAALVAVALGHFLRGLPIQVSDSYGNLLQLSLPWSDLMQEKFTQPGFLRPLLWAQLKLVHDLSGGNYTDWFRWTHVLQGFALTLLFVALVRVRGMRDAACLPWGFAVLFGIHTFSGLVTEAFPVNMYLSVVICCVAAAVVALSAWHWWSDWIAVLLFVAATLTLETGLLVWVVCVGAALLGARGVSVRGLVLMTVLLGLYFVARFGVLGVGSPNLMERSSGFGFAVLDPPELVERFGANPLPFYAYNVAASLLTVVLSEPSSGVFRATQALTTARVSAPIVVNAVASVGSLALLLWFAWTRRHAWRTRRFEHDDRLVLIFTLVLLANAAISYPYTKDVIMAPAGVFLAAAVAAAARGLMAMPRLPAAGTLRTLVVVACVVVVTSAWSVRALGLFERLRGAGVRERLDWAYIESDLSDGVVHAPDARARALLEQLRHDALIARPAPPPLELPLSSLRSE